MRTFHIWERGVYQARDIEAEFMRQAVFAVCRFWRTEAGRRRSVVHA